MKKILGILAGAALLAATPAHATNGMRMIGFGPIQNSMGGASVAAPLDSATIVSNPAGLAALGQRIDLAAQAFMPSVKYSMSMPGFSAGQTSDRPTDFLPTLGGVYRVQDQLSLGFAALGTAGMGVDYGAVPNQASPGTSRLYSSYLNGRVAPAVAYKLNDQFAVGLALNIMYAQMQFQMEGSQKYNASSFGYGATVGVAYKPVDIVTIGASYETKSFFQDFEDTMFGQKIKVALDQPMIATVGAAVRPAAGLLLAADLEWINWSDVMGADKPKITTQLPFPSSFDMKWSDQWVVKVGGQYAIPSLEALKVRLGYNYGAMPLDKNNVGANMMFPAVAEHHVTVGAGYDVGSFAVNAAFVFSPEASAKFTEPNGMTIESKMSQTAFELGAAYKF